MSTSVLKALRGKLDIKKHSPSILYLSTLYTGWINELMSWKPFVPLGRLTYMAYLVHPIVMLSYYMSRRQLAYFNNYEVVGSDILSISFIVNSSPIGGHI